MAEGIYNLPTLYAISDPIRGEELRSLLGQPVDEGDRERARKLVVASDGIDRTVRAAQRFLDQANVALAQIPSERLRAGFGSLIASLLEDLPGY